MSAASGGNSEPKQGQRSQSARGFCPRSTMRVPQPDIIEHFGNADAVPQPPERCLSRKAGIVRCCPNISFIKKTNSVAPSLYRSFFFPLLFLFLSTNIFLFASQFYGNSFVDFGTCCYTYNSSIVAVAKISIAAVLFSPISKRFICLFSCFLIKQHPIPEIFTTHFLGIAFSRCLSARFSGIKQRFLPRKFWCRKVHLLHPIILFLHILLYNTLVFSHLFFAAFFPSIIPFCPTLFRPFLP